jgi:uncharacterized protein YyaL (SSP411 family)
MRRALLLVLVLAACAPGRESDPLPGAPSVPSALARRLAHALAGKGPGYRPHTRHLRDDGTPRFTNRLILETSPYLLQHAHNPVDWYPWGEEAFARARRESRPVLLSVGYSTCHWCHVMEEESFEDEEIARYLNEHYVAIKVDREERPDLDEAYMSAVQAVSGSGGWPMTVWLTPERKPFYGGTYFPPRDGDHGRRRGFLSLLRALHDFFAERPLAVAEQADALTEAVRRLAAPEAGDRLPDAGALRAAYAALAGDFDPEHGGFGGAPRFPSPPVLDFLLRYHRRTGEAHALEMVTRTLEAMAAGGIRDHVGGGFHRYATDVGWGVPHFEKTLYDNAQLAVVYLDAFQATGRAEFAAVAREILDWLAREMSDARGGFWSATDADSAGEEGTFFVWTRAQLDAVLEPGEAAAVAAFYGVTDAGNFHGATVLHVARPLGAVAADIGTAPEGLATTLATAREKLRTARAMRPAPATDTKVLAAWNGLAISAFARGAAVLDDDGYRARARAAAAFVLDHMRDGERLRRSDGATVGGFLDDYAFMAAGLVDLYEATFDPRWLREALALQAVLARDFWDDAGGGFFATARDAEPGLARAKPASDSVVPSGNAVAAETALRLAEFTGDDTHRRRADDTLRALGAALARAPTSAPRLLAALDFRLDRAKEIVIVAPAGAPDGAAPLLAEVRRIYLPNRVLTVAAEGAPLAAQAAVVPLAEGKTALGGHATAYVCEQGVCALPTADAGVLAAQLARVVPLP